MAVSLNPDDWARLIDLYQGGDDLHKGFIRILHSNSFIDDATRNVAGPYDTNNG